MPLRDLLGLFLLAAGWGPTFLLIKIGVETVSPLALSTLRCASASLFLIVFCLITRRKFRPVLSHWKDLLFMAIVGNAVPFIACAWAETMVQSSTAGIIEGTVPIITAVLTTLFTPHRPLKKEQVFGIILGFIGILVIFAPDLIQLESSTEERMIGKVMLIFMSFCFAASFVFSKERLEHLPHIPSVALQLFFAFVIVSILTLLFEGPSTFKDYTVSSFWIVCVLGVFTTAIPWCVYFYLIKRGSAVQVSFAIYLLPVVAIFLGWVFLDEKLRWNLALGTGVILLSLLLAGGIFPRRKLPQHDNPLLKS